MKILDEFNGARKRGRCKFVNLLVCFGNLYNQAECNNIVKGGQSLG